MYPVWEVWIDDTFGTVVLWAAEQGESAERVLEAVRATKMAQFEREYNGSGLSRIDGVWSERPGLLADWHE